MFDSILQSVAAAGPLAGVLGLGCYMFWKQNVAERDRHEAEMKAERDRHATEEENLRKKNEDLLEEYVQTLKSLTSAMRDGKDDTHD